MELVIPDLIRDPTFLVRSEEKAGSRIKSGMTMGLRPVYEITAVLCRILRAADSYIEQSATVIG